MDGVGLLDRISGADTDISVVVCHFVLDCCLRRRLPSVAESSVGSRLGDGSPVGEGEGEGGDRLMVAAHGVPSNGDGKAEVVAGCPGSSS